MLLLSPSARNAACRKHDNCIICRGALSTAQFDAIGRKTRDCKKQEVKKKKKKSNSAPEWGMGAARTLVGLCSTMRCKIRQRNRTRPKRIGGGGFGSLPTVESAAACLRLVSARMDIGLHSFFFFSLLSCNARGAHLDEQTRWPIAWDLLRQQHGNPHDAFIHFPASSGRGNESLSMVTPCGTGEASAHAVNEELGVACKVAAPRRGCAQCQNTKPGSDAWPGTCIRTRSIPWLLGGLLLLLPRKVVRRNTHVPLCTGRHDNGIGSPCLHV